MQKHTLVNVAVLKYNLSFCHRWPDGIDGADGMRTWLYGYKRQIRFMRGCEMCVSAFVVNEQRGYSCTINIVLYRLAVFKTKVIKKKKNHQRQLKKSHLSKVPSHLNQHSKGLHRADVY